MRRDLEAWELLCYLGERVKARTPVPKLQAVTPLGDDIKGGSL